MAEGKNGQREFDTCLEGIPCAEMMHKMLGRKGIGSLCTEMMKRMRTHHGEEGCFACAEILQSMIKEFGGMKAESPTPKKQGD